MINKATISTISLFLFLSLAFGQDIWTQKANFPCIGRAAAYSFSIERKGYFGLGADSTGIKKDLWEWDQATNVWTQMANLPANPRRVGVAFSIGTKGYICVGVDSLNNGTRDVWEWNQNNNTWSKKASFPNDNATLTVGFSIGSKGYIGTGIGSNINNSKEFWEYDPILDTWTRKADFGGLGRYDAQGFSIGDKGYIGGGWNDHGVYFSDFWEYDPASDTWSKKADLPENRNNSIGFSVCKKGYFMGGHCSNGTTFWYSNDLIEYDPSTNIWTQTTPLPSYPRDIASGFSIGNKGYVGIGWIWNPPICVNDFWEYTPDPLCSDTTFPPIDTITPPDEVSIVFIPNIFSPNSDGQNDVMFVRGKNIYSIEFLIYDRWGEQVFETSNINIGWNGKYKNKDCEPGVYVYVANISFTNGESVLKKGNVTLVR